MEKSEKYKILINKIHKNQVLPKYKINIEINQENQKNSPFQDRNII